MPAPSSVTGLVLLLPKATIEAVIREASARGQGDVHRAVAAHVLNCGYDAVPKESRQEAKRALFAHFYGGKL